ncbi:MAG: LD-carboxypeptidase [bacterium]|nr:LD-carboxypeptidase [bacterium]
MISKATLPPPVRPGDRIGVAALSGPVDPDRLLAGLDALRSMGYEPVEAANLRSCCGIFAGSDAERLAAFHALAADESVAAIVFARGGSGLLRVLPDVDWRLLGRRPRAYVGYSDLTPFLLQVVARLGLVAFHGPMVAADFARGLTGRERASFESALAGALPTTLPVSCEGSAEAVEGPLVGGCLSMVASTLGTPYEPDLEDAILLLEEVGEPLYRFDRMLTQLRLSGNLARLKGVVAGHLEGEGGDPLRADSGDTLLRQLRDETRNEPWPLAWGLPAGHAAPNMTLPLGLLARLDSAAGRLTVGPGA